MRILLIVDFLDNWSAHNGAKAIAKFTPQHEFVIRGADSGKSILDDAGQFDVVHFRYSAGLTDFYEWIWKHKHRCVLTAINERSYFNDYEVDGPRFRQLMNQCPWVTSVSRRVADACSATWIPNGIDEEIFDAAKRPIVGHAGTGARIKGIHEVRQACADLDVELRTAGYSRGSGHSRPHGEMKHFYKGLDVYVHASKTEGFNNTILEALACNCPVIMSKAGCWREFEGWVDFCDSSVEGIKVALRKFLGRRLIVDRFLWRSIVPEYVRIYEEIHAAYPGTIGVPSQPLGVHGPARSRGRGL